MGSIEFRCGDLRNVGLAFLSVDDITGFYYLVQRVLEGDLIFFVFEEEIVVLYPQVPEAVR